MELVKIETKSQKKKTNIPWSEKQRTNPGNWNISNLSGRHFEFSKI